MNTVQQKTISNTLKVHVVIGNPNSGKSTTIRHLSGCRIKENNWHICVNGSSRIFVVRMSSLQEKSISPQDFINEINQITHPVTDILLPLRLQKRAAFPDYAAYLLAFQNAGWQIASLAFMSQHQPSNTYGAAVYMHQQPNNWRLQPSNLIADNIRSAWGW
ncbi:hypothetical protein [Aquaspirillum serpens]|uniref:hypothetical protein n=1 Tax=Aquaspirillum serpens TaxID=190 RepID=UPI0003B7B5C7|nr:hypothetical protein [Aquaspirillum serpens]